MAITVRNITKIICDGAHAPCRDGSEVIFAQPQSVALRLAARAGWYVNESYVCPVCATAAGVARTVGFVTSVIRNSLDLVDLDDRRYGVSDAA